eukprot:1161656-Pelagomonas_calceolata.AAC.10
MEPGIQLATTSTAARTNTECAGCQICNYPAGYEPVNSEPPYLDMYILAANKYTTGLKCEPLA